MKTLSQMSRYLDKVAMESAKETFWDRVKINLRALYFDGKHWSHQRCMNNLKMARLSVDEENLNG